MSAAPTVPTGTLYGLCALGATIRSRTKATNSSTIPKQYKKFSAATISSKLIHDSTKTPEADNRIPTVGVPCLDRLAKSSGIIPRSAIPSSWNESELISVTNMPTLAAAAAARTHHPSHEPAMASATSAKYPSVHSSRCRGTAPVPVSIRKDDKDEGVKQGLREGRFWVFDLAGYGADRVPVVEVPEESVEVQIPVDVANVSG
ncbi:peroxin 3-1 [Striga asiatica]|uniref:Peroxin 3-1 n=1 Tax=Striga asiatica TaxID=4170 RepID=A0A5A7RGA3_STRAF|nr:peroxin 3-1 [Striga asiatica]